MLNFIELAALATQLQEEATAALEQLTPPSDRTQFTIANQVVSLLGPLATAFKSFVPPLELDMSAITITDPTVGDSVEPLPEPDDV